MPVPIAFFGAAVLIVVTGALPLRELYNQIDGPILIMLAALIPVSDSLRETGATDLIARALSSIAIGPAALRGAGPHHARRDGGDAVPQQRRDRAGDGADRGDLRAAISGSGPTPS